MAAKIIAVLVIIIGIGTSLWLIRNPQVFQPKATESTDISFQSHYNPFGDPWASNIGTNPDIPIILSTGCYRRGPKWTGRQTDPNVSDEEINHLAKSNTGLIFEECASLQGPNSELNRQRLINIATKLKQKNPNAKYIGYHVFWVIDFDPQFSTDIYAKAEADQMCGGAKCETFFIHKKGLPPTKANRLGHYLDITNPYYRQYIAPKIAQTLTEMNMDGFLADGVTPFLPGVDNNLIPDDIRNNWSASWPDLLRDVKAAIGPNKLLFVNSGGHGVNFSRAMVSNDGNSPRADGLMWEDPFGPLGGDIVSSGRLAEINSMLDMVTSLNKYLMIVVNTNVNCGNYSGQPARYCYDQTNKAQQSSFQKYYLSLFLNVFRNNKTTLIYYNPLLTGPQFDSEAFFRDWNLKIGQPTTGMQEVSPGVFLRKFQKAWVYWNNSNGGYTVAGAGLYNLNGTQASQHSIPAKSGAIYVTQAVLTDWNQPPPSPSPIISPSPSIIPSPSTIPSPLNCTTKPLLSKPAVMGANGLTVSLTAGTNAEVPSNQLYQIKFTGFDNGTVTIGNSSYTQVFDYNVPAGTTTVSFLIKQANFGQATNITLKAIDKCGENQQFFGGGTGAGWPNPNPSPSPVTVSPSPSPLTVKPNIFPDQSSSYCIGNAPRNHLQWSSVPGSVIYKVFRETSTPGSGIKIGETSGIATNDDNSVNGVSYTYRIEATSSTGASIVGDPFNLTTTICPVVASPSPSPSPAKKIGDIDNNGRVDIFDFNFLVEDYRSSNLRSDLNSDNKVDLFDFNLLITNFGI